jgi:hypothetical protein
LSGGHGPPFLSEKDSVSRAHPTQDISFHAYLLTTISTIPADGRFAGGAFVVQLSFPAVADAARLVDDVDRRPASVVPRLPVRGSRGISAGNTSPRRRQHRDGSRRLQSSFSNHMIMKTADARPRKDVGYPMRSRCRPALKEPSGPLTYWWAEIWIFFRRGDGATRVPVRGGDTTLFGEDHELS